MSLLEACKSKLRYLLQGANYPTKMTNRDAVLAPIEVNLLGSRLEAKAILIRRNLCCTPSRLLKKDLVARLVG
jgi:hypothetical protein